MNLKTGQLQSTSLRTEGRGDEETLTEPEIPVGRNEMCQHMCNCSPRRRGERNRGAGRLYEQQWPENSPNLMENINLQTHGA